MLKLGLISLFFIFILEVFARFFFPQFNYNRIFYSVDGKHSVFNGVDTYNYFDKTSDLFSFRVKNKNEELKIKSDKKKILIIGDSVTLGLGVEFDEVYYQKFASNLKNKNIKVLAASTIGVNYSPIFQASKDFLSILNPKDVLVYQFNYNDIISHERIYKKKKLAKRTMGRKIFDKLQVIRFKYLNHSTLVKLLDHHASRQFRNINDTCTERGVNALGMYSYAFSAEGFETESTILWKDFEKKLIELKNKLDEKKINFYVLISPISIQLENHNSINRLNLDTKCSSVDGHKNILNILENNQIKIIDPLKKFRLSQEDDFNLLFHMDDTNHPNSLGHDIMSREMLDKISLN